MKKIYLFLVILPFYFYGQVGVNTHQPEQLVHIHGKATKTVSDDVVVTESGELGIGTTSPTTKLDIVVDTKVTNPQKGFRLVDGSEQDTYVLTTDANGYGNWQPIDVTVYMTNINNGNGSYVLDANISSAKYVGQYIDLPPGVWMINFSMGMTISGASSSSSVFLRFRLLDNTTEPSNINTFSVDAIMPKLAATGFPTNLTKGVFVGSLAINNKGNSIKRYYLFADKNQGGVAASVKFEYTWNESYIYYYRIDAK